MELETIRLAGLVIHEPVTAFTDVILAIISFSCVGRIRNQMNESFFNNAWRLFFFFMGISTGIGSVAHSVGIGTGVVFDRLWMAMNTSCSIAVFFALKATIRFTRSTSKMMLLLNILNYALLLAFVFLTYLNNDFEIFKIHAAIGLFLIFLTHLIAYFKSHTGSGWIVSGMLLSFLTVLIHTLQFSLSNWFNYKDISHVIMMASLVLIYNGIYIMSENLKLSVFRANNF